MSRALASDPPLPGEPGDWAVVEPRRGEALTAARAEALAILNDRALRATLLEIGAFEGLAEQAGTPPNPELSLAITRGDHGLAVEGEVAFDVTSAILAPLAADVAGAEATAARRAAAAAAVRLRFQARAAFHAAVAAERRVAIGLAAVEILAAGRDASRALFEAGNLTELALAVEEAAYETARGTVAELELEATEAREELARVLGVDAAAMVLAGDAALPTEAAIPADVEARAVAASHELAELRARFDAAARAARLERTAGALPDVEAAVIAEREGDAWQLGGALSVGLPVFDRRQGATRAADAAAAATAARIEDRTRAVRAAARVARARVLSTHRRARHEADVVLPARERVMRQTLLQYNAMQLSIFDLVRARREQLQAELAHVETVRAYLTAVAALDAILAGALVDTAAAGASPSLGASAPEGGH